MILDDDLLTRALRESRDDMLGELPPDSELEHVFSDDFEKQMRAMLAKEKRGKKSWWSPAFARRAAAVVIVGFVGFSACFMSVDAWREKLFRMVEQKHPEYSDIVYEPEESAAAKGGRMIDRPEFKLVEYRPSYLPDGYLLTDQMLDESINWSAYNSPDRKLITFDQSILGVPSVSINTEGATLEQFDLNGDVAYKMENRGSQFVLWNDNQYQFMVVTSGLSLDEAVKIASSVKPCPPDAPHPPKLAVPEWDIPEGYTAEQAAANGDVVVSNGEIMNMNVLDTFFDEMASGKQSIIRVTDYDKGGPILNELYFDGIGGQIEQDNTRTPGQQKNHRSGYSYERIERVTEGDETVVYGIGIKNGERVELLRGKAAQP